MNGLSTLPICGECSQGGWSRIGGCWCVGQDPIGVEQGLVLDAGEGFGGTTAAHHVPVSFAQVAALYAGRGADGLRQRGS